MMEQLDRWIDKILESLDITSQMRKVTKELDKDRGGFWHHALSSLPFLFMTAVCGYLSWKFDLESTWNALALTREFLAAGTVDTSNISLWPNGIKDFSLAAIAVAGIGLLPTTLQLFGPMLARGGVSSVRLFIILLSVFDVITDIPTTTVFINQTFGVYFDSFGWLGSIMYVLTFCIILPLATFYLESVTLIFGWTALGKIFKAIGLSDEIRRDDRRPSSS